jgi:hypothetical protein
MNASCLDEFVRAPFLRFSTRPSVKKDLNSKLYQDKIYEIHVGALRMLSANILALTKQYFHIFLLPSRGDVPLTPKKINTFDPVYKDVALSTSSEKVWISPSDTILSISTCAPS